MIGSMRIVLILADVQIYSGCENDLCHPVVVHKNVWVLYMFTHVIATLGNVEKVMNLCEVTCCCLAL